MIRKQLEENPGLKAMIPPEYLALLEKKDEAPEEEPEAEEAPEAPEAPAVPTGLAKEKKGDMIDGGGTMGLIRRGLYAKGHKREDVSKQIKAEEEMLYGKIASPYVRKWRQIQKQAIYYHIKNLFLIQLTGFHSPESAESNAYSRFH